MSIWVRRAARTRPVRVRDGPLTILFHSSAPLQKRDTSLRDYPSLQPSSSEKAEQIATSRGKRVKREPFIRDSLPHADVAEPSEPREGSEPRGPNRSYRRRSPDHNERDWSQRTGKWSASRFGGGQRQGSQMGLLEDRPASYGLNTKSPGERPANNYPRPRDTHLRPTDRTSRETSRVAITQRIPWLQDDKHPETTVATVRRPAMPFGLRPEGEERAAPSKYERDGPERDSPVFGRRPAGRPPPLAGGSRSLPEIGILDETGNRGLDEPDTMSLRPLKNRNQPTVIPSRVTPLSKPKPETPPPPPKKDYDASLFENNPIVLTRASVPIITKADPATAATVSSFSPAMGLKNDRPTKFTSPPLLPGLLKRVTDLLGGSAAEPTWIQGLSLKWLVQPWTEGQENLPTSSTEETAVGTETSDDKYKEFILSADTGSGKSIAFLLPVLQALKLSEARRLAEEVLPSASKRGLNPRALILEPTHELARQTSSVAKALLHDVKLRVLCASRANAPTRTANDGAAAGKGKKNSASRMKALLSFAEDGQLGEFQVKEADLRGAAFPVDVVVGTPMKLLEMYGGGGWERDVEFGGGVAAKPGQEKKKPAEEDAESKERGPKLRRGRDSLPGVGQWRSSPELGLSEVEWVVVDEADLLFDPDFQETTRMLLADISKARGRKVPFTPLPVGLMAPTPPTSPATPNRKEKEKEPGKNIVTTPGPSVITPLNYPFNFLLASATITKSLSSYLNAYHPRMQRLLAPSSNHLPKSLKTEFVNWTGGNKNSDVERRLRKVWAEDAASGLGPVPDSLGDMSKVLIFCNKNTKVTDLGEFLEGKGIKTIQMAGAGSQNRKRGNNKHLSGFLKTTTPAVSKQLDDWSSSWVADEEPAPEVVEKKTNKKRSLLPISKQDLPAEEPVNDPMNVPHVMITTSIFSRGLDFSPNVKHVFIIDLPRNDVDFLHRAGRTGRAGENGKVVIFGNMEGRGSQRSKEARKRIKALRP